MDGRGRRIPGPATRAAPAKQTVPAGGSVVEIALEDYVSETEQLQQLKSWATSNGPWMLAGIAVVVLGFGGYRQWQAWQESKATRASERYTQVLESLSKEDRAGAQKLADSLRADYAGSPYADQADLALARSLVESNRLPEAETRLVLVADHSKDEALRILARYRLARIQRAEGHVDAAEKTLAAGPGGGFEAAFAELKGDMAADRGDKAAALAAYKVAQAGEADGLVNRDVLELKIAALGGEPAADAATAPVAAVAP